MAHEDHAAEAATLEDDDLAVEFAIAHREYKKRAPNKLTDPDYPDFRDRMDALRTELARRAQRQEGDALAETATVQVDGNTPS